MAATSAGEDLQKSTESLELLRSVAGEVSDRAEELVDEATLYIVESLPTLGGDEVSRTDLRGSVSANVYMIFAMLRGEARSADVAPPPGAVEFARGLVHQGESLVNLLEAYHFGHQRAWEWWMQRLAERERDPTRLLAATHLLTSMLFEYIGVATQGVAAHYTDERERWLEGATARRRETIEAILEGTPVDMDAASRRLGHELRRHQTAFVLWSDPVGDPDQVIATLEHAAAVITKELEAGRPLVVPAGHSILWAWVGTHGCPELDGLRAALEASPDLAGVHVAAGYPGMGLDGFRDGHEEALHAQRVALLRAEPAAMTFYEDVEVASLVDADLRRARRFVQRELAELSRPDERTGRLRETVRVLLEEGGSARRAAERLGTHKNTVFYRLERAETLLGHPIGDRRVRLMLALALAESLGERALPDAE